MKRLIFGPRRINEFRRIAIPRRAGDILGLHPKTWVVVSPHRSDHTILVIKPDMTTPMPGGRLDPRRPRRISETGQLTLPAVLMESAGLKVGHWVAFSCTSTFLRVYAADRVTGPSLGRS